MASETDPSMPTADFVGRVMTSVALTPAPSAPRSFADAVRDRSMTDAIGAVVVAAHLALAAGRVPRVIRAQALVLVALVALLAGTGATLAATTAARVAGPILSGAADVDRDDGARPATPSSAPIEAAPSPALLAPVMPVPGVVDGADVPRRPIGHPRPTPEPTDRAGGDDGDAEATRPPSRRAEEERDGDDGGQGSGSTSDGEDRASEDDHAGDGDDATNDEHQEEDGDAASDDPGGSDGAGMDDGEDGHDGSDDGGGGGGDGGDTEGGD